MVRILVSLLALPWLPQTRAAAIDSLLLETTAPGMTPPPAMAPSPPVPFDDCSLQHAVGQVGCATEESQPDLHLLDASSIHNILETYTDATNAQHPETGTSDSTVNYPRISTIFGGLGLFVATVWGPFAKSYWDKLQSTNAASNPELGPQSTVTTPNPELQLQNTNTSSNPESELGSSGNQTA